MLIFPDVLIIKKAGVKSLRLFIGNLSIKCQPLPALWLALLWHLLSHWLRSSTFFNRY